MKNEKGQALVEFIFVLPLIITLIFGMIELGNMIHNKYLLQSHLDPLIELYKAGKNDVLETYKKNNDINFIFSQNGNLVTVVVTKKIFVMTPGLNLILDNPYIIESRRDFYIDEQVETETE